MNFMLKSKSFQPQSFSFLSKIIAKFKSKFFFFSICFETKRKKYRVFCTINQYNCKIADYKAFWMIDIYCSLKSVSIFLQWNQSLMPWKQ